MLVYNSNNNYGIVAKLLHWVVGLSIISLLTSGYLMTYTLYTGNKGDLYAIHKGLGFITLMLVILRIVWRFLNISPSPSPHLSSWQLLIFKSNVFFLYLLMLLMPLSGFTSSIMSGHPINVFNLFTIPSLANNHILGQLAHSSHIILSYFILACIILHIFASFYHHLRFKENIIKKIL